MRKINICKLNSKRAGQAGFSLVELMVVVAIIGVLATIAIPNVNKFINKARTAEAKSMMASIYTSEKGFLAEWNSYHSMLGAIGFAPDGLIRYNVGFTASMTVQNFTNPTTSPQTSLNTSTYCAGAGAAVCSFNGTANAILGSSISPNAFTIGAIATLPNGVGNDTWTMDNLKTLRNTVPGI